MSRILAPLALVALLLAAWEIAVRTRKSFKTGFVKFRIKCSQLVPGVTCTRPGAWDCR